MHVTDCAMAESDDDEGAPHNASARVEDDDDNDKRPGSLADQTDAMDEPMAGFPCQSPWQLYSESLSFKKPYPQETLCGRFVKKLKSLIHPAEARKLGFKL